MNNKLTLDLMTVYIETRQYKSCSQTKMATFNFALQGEGTILLQWLNLQVHQMSTLMLTTSSILCSLRLRKYIQVDGYFIETVIQP